MTAKGTYWNYKVNGHLAAQRLIGNYRESSAYLAVLCIDLFENVEKQEGGTKTA